MSLKEEIKGYIDGNGLVAHWKIDDEGRTPGRRGSDNGVMYTSEYYIMLAKGNPEFNKTIDQVDFLTLISPCFGPGCLQRDPHNLDQEGPDDYLGLFAACKILNLPILPRMIIAYGWKNKGIFNNEKPGVFSWSAFLVRQPQLIAAAYSAADNKKWWLAPLYWYAALVIAVAGYKVPINETDPRRLSWLLIQCVKNDSWLCKLAAKLWYKRLYKDYGLDGMKAVAKIYYQKGHPFAKYWID